MSCELKVDFFWEEKQFPYVPSTLHFIYLFFSLSASKWDFFYLSMRVVSIVTNGSYHQCMGACLSLTVSDENSFIFLYLISS